MQLHLNHRILNRIPELIRFLFVFFVKTNTLRPSLRAPQATP